jgi:hypothetical protein
MNLGPEILISMPEKEETMPEKEEIIPEKEEIMSEKEETIPEKEEIIPEKDEVPSIDLDNEQSIFSNVEYKKLLKTIQDDVYINLFNNSAKIAAKSGRSQFLVVFDEEVPEFIMKKIKKYYDASSLRSQSGVMYTFAPL